jgi:dipeptidase
MTRLAIPLLATLFVTACASSQSTVANLDGQDDNWDACTSIMVSRGATKDGSVMITYSADAAFLPKLLHHTGGPKKAGTMIDAVGWENERVRGQVRQVARTHSVVGLMNEYQLALGETTTGGRRELRDRKGILDYDALMWLTLQRAKTAREAIATINSLCAEYGYGSGGETFAIADKNEAWVMELIGKGPGVKGIVWVAARVPEGFLSASANMSRITTFPLDDPDNWRYAKDVVTFATEKGFYDPKAGAPFSYRDAYHPTTRPTSKRACATRIWSIYRRAAPSSTFSSDFHRGVEGSKDYPLFVRAEKKLSVRDVMGLMRDHYEGTDFDMTKGIDAGPFGSPYRFRGLSFQLDGKSYCWERPIATQQAGFVMLSQCRNWLPDPVGGVYWFTPDDPYTSCFTPLYCGITRLPKSYTVGDHDKFSWESAWWVFNHVSNLTYDRWSRVLPDVQKVQVEQEEMFLKMMKAIDSAATELVKTDRTLARKFLTDWSVGTGDRLFETWRELCGFIITKHNDGYINEIVGRPRGVGYPEAWLREVLKKKGDKLRLPSESGRRGSR